MDSNKGTKKSFLFYESFYEAINKMPDEQALKAYKAIARYGLYCEEPTVNNDLTLDIVFTMAKPLIDQAIARRVNGNKGGRPSSKGNYNQSSSQPHQNQPIREELSF